METTTRRFRAFAFVLVSTAMGMPLVAQTEGEELSAQDKALIPEARPVGDLPGGSGEGKGSSDEGDRLLDSAPDDLPEPEDPGELARRRLGLDDEGKTGLAEGESGIDLSDFLAAEAEMLPLFSLPPAEPFGLRAYLDKVIQHNENVHLQLLQYEISRRNIDVLKGDMEPNLVLNSSYDRNERPNTVEQRRNLDGITEFNERNQLYSAAVEMLNEFGGRSRVGFNINRLKNNLQDRTDLNSTNPGSTEYLTFFGVSLTQPLLRGAGRDAAMAQVRVASLESEQAFQEYRRQLMVIVSGAEAAYWNLYYAQEQERFFDESFKLADKLYQDSKASFSAGRLSGLEVLSAQAGLVDRRARLSEARQKLLEAATVAASFFAGAQQYETSMPRAQAPPLAASPLPTQSECLVSAYHHNPDYLTRRRQIEIERVRVKLAKNQARPQLDLTASYGFNGLASTAGDAVDELGNGTFPTWSLGLEMRVPLGGMKREKGNLNIAQMRREQANIGLTETDVQLKNAITNTITRARSIRDSIASYRIAVKLQQTVLDAELKRLSVGKSNNRKVLEIERDLFMAKNTLLNSIILHQRALLELEMVMGRTLALRGFELSRQKIAVATARLLKKRRISEQDFEEFRRAVRRNLLTNEQGFPAAEPTPTRSASPIKSIFRKP